MQQPRPRTTDRLRQRGSIRTIATRRSLCACETDVATFLQRAPRRRCARRGKRQNWPCARARHELRDSQSKNARKPAQLAPPARTRAASAPPAAPPRGACAADPPDYARWLLTREHGRRGRDTRLMSRPCASGPRRWRGQLAASRASATELCAPLQYVWPGALSPRAIAGGLSAMPLRVRSMRVHAAPRRRRAVRTHALSRRGDTRPSTSPFPRPCLRWLQAVVQQCAAPVCAAGQARTETATLRAALTP
mmetsp:Transcript_3380/g.8365  ORF Transcript_3380/g.8365 Transcript_3380/m.8365 type:complete len:250 (-) Transcript_3380:966-1715(-)